MEYTKLLPSFKNSNYVAMKQQYRLNTIALAKALYYFDSSSIRCAKCKQCIDPGDPCLSAVHNCPSSLQDKSSPASAPGKSQSQVGIVKNTHSVHQKQQEAQNMEAEPSCSQVAPQRHAPTHEPFNAPHESTFVSAPVMPTTLIDDTHKPAAASPVAPLDMEVDPQVPQSVQPFETDIDQTGMEPTQSSPSSKSKKKNIVKVESVQMTEFINRLNSFKGKAELFTVQVIDLANAGLYYIGPKDKVKCAYCSKSLRAWEPNDIPMTEHKRISPDCSFVNNTPPPVVPSTSSMSNQFASLDIEPGARTVMDQAIHKIATSLNDAELLRVCNFLNINVTEIESSHIHNSRDKHRLMVHRLREQSQRLSLPHLIEASTLVNNVELRVELGKLRSQHMAPAAAAPAAAAPAPSTTLTSSSQASQQLNPEGTPKHPRFQEFDARVESFTKSRWGTVAKKYQFAAAGFFYTGDQDYLRCFWCSGGLKDWEEGDEPWEEHARWFSTCSYVLYNKGHQYVDQVRAKYAAPPPAENFSSQMSSSSGESDDEDDLTPNEQRVVERVADMGFPVLIVKQLLQAHCEGIENPDMLVDKLLEVLVTRDTLQCDNDGMSLGTHVDQSGSNGAVDVRTMDTAVADSIGMVEDGQNTNAPAKPKKKRKRNRKKKKKQNGDAGSSSIGGSADLNFMMLGRECRICMDAEAHMVFLPCGHICCCEKCSKSVQHCPICRATIRRSHHVFFS